MKAQPRRAVGSARRDGGFTLVELLVVVLIIGILVGIAVPVYGQTRAVAKRRTCFANQRTIEGAVSMFLTDSDSDVTALAGVVDAAHPICQSSLLGRPPRCASAPTPADPANPTAAEGAYTLQADGFVAPCGFEGHGHF